MIDHVLVPMDDSPLARRALEFALAVHPDATFTVLYVVDYVEESYGAEMLVGPQELRDRATARADRILADARDLAADHDAALTTVTTRCRSSPTTARATNSSVSCTRSSAISHRTLV